MISALKKHGKLLKGLGVGLVVLGIFFVPLILGRFWQYLIANILLLSLFSLSFNLLFGMTGYLSFGHAAFYATGAYVTGMLLLADFSLIVSVALGTAASGLLAVILGFFCVRHTKIYFSLLTLALGMMIHAIVWKWTSVTGGDDGLVGIMRGSIKIPGLFEISLDSLSHYYYFLAALCLLGIYILYRIVKSPFGLVLNGLRENYGRVEFAGIPIRKYLQVTFFIAGLFAGLAGSLMAPLEKTVAPSVAHWTKSAEPVMASLIGGPFTFAGPIVGALAFIGLKELVVRFTDYWLMVFGIILMVIVLGFRGGIVGFIGDHLRERRNLALRDHP
jgi:branched-chain amino acid transport system permease protein